MAGPGPLLAHPVVKDDLVRVEETLRSSVVAEDPFLTEIASHLMTAGGKRGRPLFAVAAAATAMFTVFGVAYSFGAFFDSMADDFGTGSGATALVFSVTISLSFALAPITGRYADRLGPRRRPARRSARSPVPRSLRSRRRDFAPNRCKISPPMNWASGVKGRELDNVAGDG